MKCLSPSFSSGHWQCLVYNIYLHICRMQRHGLFAHVADDRFLSAGCNALWVPMGARNEVPEGCTRRGAPAFKEICRVKSYIYRSRWIGGVRLILGERDTLDRKWGEWDIFRASPLMYTYMIYNTYCCTSALLMYCFQYWQHEPAEWVTFELLARPFLCVGVPPCCLETA